MDRIYANQRHIYDGTRKFYLLGRDGLIADLEPPVGGTIIEIGCGTGRNLIKIARRHPAAMCYGLDVSRAMLETARASVKRAGLQGRVFLAEADATNFDAKALFGIAAFDRVVISYALSMIPPWQAVLRQSTEVVARGGSLHVVDFGDQAGLPRAFKAVLARWLSWFHVSPRETLPQEIADLGRDLGLRASTRPLFRGYALAASLHR